MIVCGIDPGLSGAVAVLDGDGRVIEAVDMPTLRIGKKQEIDEPGLKDLLTRHHLGHVFCEKVNAFPGQGVTSMFRLGHCLGMIRGMCAALPIPYTLVTPQQWHGAYLAGMSHEKGASVFRVKQLYPSLIIARVKDHNRCDAILIGLTGLRILNHKGE